MESFSRVVVFVGKKWRIITFSHNQRQKTESIKEIVFLGITA
jgi:hypothetical protein